MSLADNFYPGQLIIATEKVRIWVPSARGGTSINRYLPMAREYHATHIVWNDWVYRIEDAEAGLY